MLSEIEKMFHQEVREKKKIGSNIFKRSSTRRGGAGTVRSAYDLMSNKERKKLNGKVKVYNMNDLLEKVEFNKLSQMEKKERLEYWRENYKNTDIIKALGIHASTYYALLDDLKIKRDSAGRGRQTVSANNVLSAKEMEYYKDNICSYSELMSLEVEQRMELFEHYNTQYSTSELVQKLGTSSHNIYYLRNKFKTLRGKKKKGKIVATQPKPNKEDVTVVEEINEFETVEPTDVHVDASNGSTEAQVEEIKGNFSISIQLNGEYTKAEFLQNVTNFLNLLSEDEVVDFKFSMDK